VNFEAAPY